MQELNLQKTYRSGTCNSFSKQQIGQTVKVAGWVNTIRDHGGVTFIDVRDQTGIVQLVVNNSEAIKGVTKECVISAEGKVRSRGEGNINPKLQTGDIEIDVSKLTILGPVLAPLPFEIENSKEVRDDVRLKYRYLGTIVVSPGTIIVAINIAQIIVLPLNCIRENAKDAGIVTARRRIIVTHTVTIVFEYQLKKLSFPSTVL